jgi:hypothetical protein
MPEDILKVEATDSVPASGGSSARPPMAMNYRRPMQHEYFLTQSLLMMIFTSIGLLFVIMQFFGTALDDGNSARRLCADYLAYLCVVLIIVLRRARRLTKADLAFVGFGYLVFVIFTEPFF